MNNQHERTSPQKTPPGDLEKIAEEPKKKKKHQNRKGKNSNTSSSDASEEKKNKSQKGNNIMKDLIAEHFVMLQLIGKGAFGQILLSFNTREGIEVAIKKEMKKPNKPPQLKTEAKVYSSLLSINSSDITGVNALAQEKVQGVPEFYGMGEGSDFWYLIMEFLGPNLIELLNYCGTRKFTISTVCLIALQIINRIENVHKHHYLHRDIKPENFLIGIQDKSNIVFLIDFGLSKKYKNPKNYQHIPYREGRLLTGTARYVSINTHLGIEQSRRDDLESIGYVLVFFLKGSLPWQGLKVGNDKYTRIMEKKLQIPTEILCYGLPDEISYYLNYCKSLRFEDRPDYDYLRGLFIKLLGTCNSLYGLTKEYLKFDWCFDDPANTIWLLFNKNKKGKILEENNSPNNREPSLVANSNKEEAKGSLKIVTKDKNGFGVKQLTNIDEKEDKDGAKTNENNPLISDNSSHDSSQVDGKGNHSLQESEETLKEEFQGYSRKDTEVNNLFNLLSNEKDEDIDKYILQLLAGNGTSKQISANPSSSNSNININALPKKSNEVTVMGEKNKKKLKDSLDISPSHPNDSKKKEGKSNSKYDKKQFKEKEESSDDDDEDDEDIENKKVLITNTIRNSKLLTAEELNKAVSGIKIPEKKKKAVKPAAGSQGNKKESLVSNKHKEKGKGNSDDSSFKSNESSRKDSSGSNASEELKDAKNKKTTQSNSQLTLKGSGISLQTKQSHDSTKKNAKGNELLNLGTKSANVSSSRGKKDESVSPKANGKSFESEIMPKISNPEIKERRKSKILEMNLLPQMQEMKVSKENMIKISKEQLSKYYEIKGELGHGSYGQVSRVHHKKLGEDRAMKIVNKKSESSQNEVEILRKISHPNIVNVFEIYEDSKKYYIMSELLEGGELFEEITSQGFFSESDAVKIMKQLLNAINYLHSRNIVHRDLKPENIMLTAKKNEAKYRYEIKIIDFGTAKILEPKQKLNKFIGTSYYIAPEVLKECYDEKCDVWSCGVILYILLCGYPPFNGNSNVDIYHNIQNNQPIFAGEEWREVTKEAIDLIKIMLNKNPGKRYSAEACLSHKWFKLFEQEEESNAKMSKKVQKSVINKMAEFVTQNRFKQAVLQFISTQFNLKKEEEDLRELFKQLDTAKKGQITKEAFCDQLCQLYGENDGKEISNRIFSHLDLDGSGEISYDEFVSSMIDSKKVITADRLEKAFKMFDKDNNGRLSVEEIINVFGGDEKSWKGVIKEIDLNKDGEVDLAEFKAMMKNIDKKLVFGDKTMSH